MLIAEDLCLSYLGGGMETHVLRNASLQVQQGEFLGLMGPSGSGKSTLLYLLAGLKSPTRGRVRYQGNCLAEMRPAERTALRHKHFGLIFQMHFLINYLTVIENILVPFPRPTRADVNMVVHLLERFHMAHLADRFPPQLSGGQRQRVAALRAIAAQPQVIFADEPTASLDHQTGTELMAVLEEYQRAGGTLIVVTHNPSSVARASRILHVWNGGVHDQPRSEPVTAHPPAALHSGDPATGWAGNGVV